MMCPQWVTTLPMAWMGKQTATYRDETTAKPQTDSLLQRCKDASKEKKQNQKEKDQRNETKIKQKGKK